MNASDDVELSVVLRVVGGDRFLHRCLQVLTLHARSNEIEFIIPTDATVLGVEAARREFPGLLFVDAGELPANRLRQSPGTAHDLLDRRTAQGLARARGRVIAIIEDNHVPATDWCDQIVTAHRELAHAVIGGCVLHGGQGLVSWASYFLDFGRYQPPFAEGPAEYLTDTNISYKREALESVREKWAESYNEVIVNWALASRGATLWRRPQMVVRLDRGHRRLRTMMMERFFWGRLFASVRVKEISLARRLLHAFTTPALVAVLLARSAIKAWSAPGHFKWFVMALPATLALTVAWCAGEFVGYVTGREGAE